ncbi:DUF3568 family protein [Desulfonauticus submarinus]
MLKNMYVKLKFFVFIIISFHLYGCFYLAVGGAGGAAGAIYYKGRIIKTINVYHSTLHKATVRALKSMGLPIEKEKVRYNGSSIESKFLDETKIWIEIEAVSQHTSKIYIRVGLLGDEERSRMLLKKIWAQL